MKRILAALLVLLLLPAACRGEAGSASPSLPDTDGGDKTVGVDIAFQDIMDFYYTYDASTDPPVYQRYRVYADGGKHWFYHESREGSVWPLTEADIVSSGAAALPETAWAAFCDLMEGGTARRRTESLETGDAGPWLYLYWSGGEREGREFAFASPEKKAAFEAFCAQMKEDQPMKISVSDGTHRIIYQLNSSPSARSLYGMLPLEAAVQNYGSNEKIFYPDQPLDTANGIEGSGSAGGLALFSPWGNVVLYYGSFGAYPGLYLLGEAVQGIEQVKDLSGTIRVEAVE